MTSLMRGRAGFANQSVRYFKSIVLSQFPNGVIVPSGDLDENGQLKKTRKMPKYNKKTEKESVGSRTIFSTAIRDVEETYVKQKLMKQYEDLQEDRKRAAQLKWNRFTGFITVKQKLMKQYEDLQEDRKRAAQLKWNRFTSERIDMKVPYRLTRRQLSPEEICSSNKYHIQSNLKAQSYF